MNFYSYGVELLELIELIELFEICRRNSHSWAIIDAVWVHGSCRNYTIPSYSFKDITGFTSLPLFG